MTGQQKTWQCSLCAYIYDESKGWDSLPDDWVCPICGAPKSDFLEITDPSPAAEPRAETDGKMGVVYECDLCQYVFDEAVEGTAWEDLPDDWICPVCGSGKESFSQQNKTASISEEKSASEHPSDDYLARWRRSSDEIETRMADIHKISETGRSVIEPMRSRMPVFFWDDILIKGSQLARLPLNKDHSVRTKTIIGPRAAVPLEIDIPVFITHMSFGALSREAKLAMAKGSAQLRTAMSSGEGGILPASLEASYKYIFEYVPNKYSVTEDNLRKVDAIDIKIGQSAKPGMGGHLPGHKVTPEIADVRGFSPGQDIISPSSFPDIRTPEDLKTTVDYLREKSGGKPIGIKLAAGHISNDIEIALYAGVDFITIDGRAGGTGAAPKVVKDACSVPSVFALARAREVLDSKQASHVSLVITGGLRISSDFAKALAMGADAVAIGTAAMMAIGCQQYRICHTGKCPVGIATQDRELRSRLDVDLSSTRMAIFLRVCAEELKDFARLSGHDNVHDLSVEDLCTTSAEISNYTTIDHV